MVGPWCLLLDALRPGQQAGVRPSAHAPVCDKALSGFGG